ncbi:histone H3 [Klebsormidium nitens]|uniref:Histone H3 n=1 Tax=Klebsormidium nitens TaxID=105231 RepID=A0A1Y1INN7_KLENI|nr:histone H3 [Klebsormidium nitens]|eukprot:GAQ90781.1 histone H3 [Klebsormidium nitens]
MTRKAATADKGKQHVSGEKRGRDVAVKNPPTPTSEPPAKKRYKARLPRSLKEIRKFQRYGSLLIRRLPFNRVIREITSKVSGRDDIRWTIDTVTALQTATEDYSSNVLEDANFAAVHAKPVTLQPNLGIQACTAHSGRYSRGQDGGAKVCGEVLAGGRRDCRPCGVGPSLEGVDPEHWVRPPKAKRTGSEARRRAEYDRRVREFDRVEREARGEEEEEAEEDETAAAAERVRVLEAALEEKARKEALKDARAHEKLEAAERARELAENREPVRKEQHAEGGGGEEVELDAALLVAEGQEELLAQQDQ